MHPKPCAHCGTMFMPRNLGDESPTICNNCQVREDNKKPKGEKPMSSIKIMVDCPQAEYARIEEIALNQGVSPSEYFMNLHKLNIQESWAVKEKPKAKEIEPEEPKSEISEEDDSPKKAKGYKKK